MKIEMKAKMILSFFALVGLTPQAFAFATPTNFFEEALMAKVKDVSEIQVIPQEKPSSEFLARVKELTFDENEKPTPYKITFKAPYREMSCSGAIILESPKLSVSKLPEGFRDRAGMVHISDCTLKGDSPIAYELNYYQVYPLDTTIPMGASTAIDSYRIYKKIQATRPKVLCTDNDMNSEGIPRAQLALHEFDNKVTFYTGVSRSSPARTVNGELIFSEDRALFFEEVDQGSLSEVRATLDLLSHKLKGTILVEFNKNDCIKAEEDGFLVQSCRADIPKERGITYQPVKEYSDVPLTLVRVNATIQTRKVQRFLLGPNGQNEIIEDKDWEVIYMFKFTSEKGDRYLRASTRFRDTPIESQPECRVSENP